MVATDRAGFDWSYMADDEVPTNMALMAFSDSEGYFHPQNLDLSNSGLEEFQQPEFKSYRHKTSKNVSEDTYNEVRESPDALMVEKLVSHDKLEKKTFFPTVAKIEFVRLNKQDQKNQFVTKDQGYVDSGCQGLRAGNIPIFLSDFKEFDGRYVTFRRGAKGGKITSKGTLILGDQCFLFTDTGCFVLFPEFKLTGESQVLLKVLRKNNMYNVDMKNIIPRDSLTCLVAKATLDESMLWHRRLGHVNLKTINKLVKENLMRGLPLKRFENDQTYVACLKGKKHKASSDSKLPTTFWAEAVNTACYVQNRCHVTIINTLDYLGKFDGKLDKGFFVGYSLNSKAFRVYNIRARKVGENLHIRYLEDKPIIAGDRPKWLFDIDVLTKSMNYVPVVAGTNSNDSVGTEESVGIGHSSKETRSSKDYILMPLWKHGLLFDSSLNNASNDEPQPSSDAGKKDDEGVSQESGIDDQERPENITTALLEATHDDFFGDEIELDMSNITTTYLVPSAQNTRIHKDHSLDHVIGDVQSGVQTRRMTKTSNEQGFISAVYEGKTHEDLHTCLFACFLSQVYPKKVYKNKKDKRVARIEAIKLFLAYASFKDFVVYQIDVKSAFLYGKIKEEVYVCQPLGFEDPEFPDKVCKVKKALYSLHQAPRAWYKTLSTYLLDNGFQRGQIDKTLFIKRVKGDILLVQVYVDDIIFGSTKKGLCTEFEKLMHKKFQMSSMGELTFFLGLQVTQKDDGIFISQDKYVDEFLKKFGFSTVKTASTPMETSKPLLKDAEAEDVYVHLYKSMIGSLMYLTASRPDIMFAVCACARFQVTPKVSHLHAMKRIFRYLKGQPKLGLWYPKDSSFNLEAYTDSDYAGASLDRKSTTRVLWIQNQMLDYGYNFMNTKIFIDNKSTICIVKNPVFHSKTKHIEIRHHFIRDSNEKKLIQMTKIHTDHNVADLLTKAFDVARFQYLIASIGMLNL
ncbi:putative ribonuclease H-like domain-containing protein [Tanacetum coccineum]